MIGVIFQFGSEIVEVRVKDNNVFFRTSNSQQFGDIDGLKLDKVGVFKEHPDLKDKEGKAMQVFLSDDYAEHIRLCGQIVKALRGEK